MRRHVRRIGAGAVAVVAALVAILLPAGPANAVPSGAGWSASWNYYNPTAFEVHMTIPGGRIDGYGPDTNGIRRFDGVVQDTDNRDRACVRMRVFATDEGWLGNVTACDGESKVVNTREFHEALFVHLDILVGGVVTKSFFTFVPSSVNDASLRTVGTGTSWAYSTAAFYHVEVHRPGVQVIGDGANQTGDERSLGAAVAHEDTDEGCVAGAAADANILVGNWTCQVGEVPAFNSFDFVGYVKVTGCYYPPSATARCLTMHVPEPH